MSFIADKQTLDDLNIPGKFKNNSIYSLFNQVHTKGGEKLLDAMFHHPLTSADEINRRCKLFRFFGTKAIVFPIDREKFSGMENYLSARGDRNFGFALVNTLRKKALGSFVKDERYQIIEKGLVITMEVLNRISDFIFQLDVQAVETPYQDKIGKAKKIFKDGRLEWLSKEPKPGKLLLLQVVRYDYLLRTALEQEMKLLLDIIYELDVFIAVGNTAREKDFSYGHALPKEQNMFRALELSHPCVPRAVGNSLSFKSDNNVVFLTGANMAGKSTFMKAFGISLYLAHMGFPVAAKELEFSIKNGIYTSINVADDLSLGYSHFYAEVLRVKSVAEQVSQSKDLVVIFDELFKGTNVKDAYDATLAVTEAFSEYRNCFFVISTHITEAGEVLREKCDNLQFVYFPTIMEGTVAVYPYKLQEGITTDRHGMMIIESEGILEMLKEV